MEQDLAEKYIPLVEQFVRKNGSHLRPQDREEFQADLMLTMVQTVRNKLDQCRDGNIEKFIWSRLAYGSLNWYRRFSKVPIATGRVSDMVECDDPGIPQSDALDFMEASCLDDRDRKILQYLIEGYGCAEMTMVEWNTPIPRTTLQGVKRRLFKRIRRRGHMEGVDV